MVGKTLDHSKWNTQSGECLNRCGRLCYVQAHFFFFSKSARKEAQVFEPLFIRIVQPGGALKRIVGRPKSAVRICGGSAYNRRFLYDDRL